MVIHRCEANTRGSLLANVFVGPGTDLVATFSRQAMLSSGTHSKGEMMQLQGQVAVVTGGGRGIGRAIARRFAAEGAAVVVTARTESEVREVVSEIQSAGGKAAAITADISHEPDCEKIVRGAREAFGAIHILVNNAGIFGPV